MDNKLSELSKPVAWASQRHIDTRHRIEAFTDEESANGTRWVKVAPLYSQEYVSALLAERDSWKRLADLRGESWEKDISDLLTARQRIAELEQKERHSERQSVIDALAGAGEAWSDIEEYMEKWDEERDKAMKEQSNG